VHKLIVVLQRHLQARVESAPLNINREAERGERRRKIIYRFTSHIHRQWIWQVVCGQENLVESLEGAFHRGCYKYNKHEEGCHHCHRHQSIDGMKVIYFILYFIFYIFYKYSKKSLSYLSHEQGERTSWARAKGRGKGEETVGI
jgi:hypothetical protein